MRDVSYGPSDVHIRWFHDGTLNARANCLDRHLAARGSRTAILWEGDDPAESRDDQPDAARVAAENVPGVRKVEDHRMRIAYLPSML
jgi:hypothetical protein